MQQLRTAHSAADTASAKQLGAGRAGAGRGLMMMMMMMMMILTMTERSEAARDGGKTLEQKGQVRSLFW
jgi:hypothetical protein